MTARCEGEIDLDPNGETPMPLPNNAGSGDLLVGNSNFLSQVQGYLNQGQGITQSLGNIWSNLTPVWANNPQQAASIGNSGYTQNMPLSISNPVQPTTGTVPPVVEAKTNYTPWILAGAAVLVVVLLVKG